jgi:hypothetical protein
MWRVYLFEFIVVLVISIAWATLIDRALKEKKEDDDRTNDTN